MNVKIPLIIVQPEKVSHIITKAKRVDKYSKLMNLVADVDIEKESHAKAVEFALKVFESLGFELIVTRDQLEKLELQWKEKE